MSLPPPPVELPPFISLTPCVYVCIRMCVPQERDYDVYKEALKSTSLPLLSEVYLQMSRKDATKPYGVHCDFLPSHTSAKESHSTCTCAFCCGWMSDLTPAQVKALSSRTGEPFPHNAKYRYKRCTNPACPLSKSTSPDTSGVIAINRDANSAVHFLQDTRLVRAGLSPQKAQETRVGWAMSGKAAKPKPVKSQQPGTKRQRRVCLSPLSSSLVHGWCFAWLNGNPPPGRSLPVLEPHLNLNVAAACGLGGRVPHHCHVRTIDCLGG